LQFPEFDDIYCRYSYVYGHDWDIASVSRDAAFLSLLSTVSFMFISVSLVSPSIIKLVAVIERGLSRLPPLGDKNEV